MILRMLAAVIVTAVLSTAVMIGLVVDRTNRFYHATAQRWARIMLWIFGIRAKIRGLEHVKAGKHYVYVSNHASMFDIPAVLGMIPDNVNIVLKKELTCVPIWGWALKLGPYIVIDRFNAREAMQSLEEAATKIRSGKSVLLFAEGTRTRDGKLQPFKRGAFTIAAKSGIPIVPVTINHTFRIMKKGSMKIHPTDIELVLEKPIVTGDAVGRDGEQHLMRKTHEAISAHYIDQTEM